VVELNPPRGTRDFPLEEMRLRIWLFDNFREMSRLMAFEEVDFPAFARLIIRQKKKARQVALAPAQMVHHRAVLALQAHDEREPARALPVEHGYLWRARCPGWKLSFFRPFSSCSSVSELRPPMWGSDYPAGRFFQAMLNITVKSTIHGVRKGYFSLNK
jgi:hypothetical protein